VPLCVKTAHSDTIQKYIISDSATEIKVVAWWHNTT
jgi:hypothetical protein